MNAVHTARFEQPAPLWPYRDGNGDVQYIACRLCAADLDLRNGEVAS